MTKIWAHRGASALAPENTMPAFEKAVEMGAGGIELDLQRTADGRLVVCHDETVDRTSNGTGAIVDLDWAAIEQLDFANGMAGFAGVRAPLLEEVFELIRSTDLTVNVELKDSIERYPGMAAQARELARSMGVADKVVWSSFNHWSLRQIRESDPGAYLGILFEEVILDPWAYARQIDAQAIHPSWWGLRLVPDAIERCHDAGVEVNVWTVNEAPVAADLVAQGADALITNHPDLRLA